MIELAGHKIYACSLPYLAYRHTMQPTRTLGQVPAPVSLLEWCPYFRGSFVHVHLYIARTTDSVLIRDFPDSGVTNKRVSFKNVYVLLN